MSKLSKFLKKILFLFNEGDKKKFFFIFLFSIFVSIIELLGISAIMPFLSIVNDTEMIENNSYIRKIYELFSFQNHITFIYVLGFLLILFYLFRSLVNLAFIKYVSNFVQFKYYDFVTKLFNIYLDIPYIKYINLNSSELNKTLIEETDGVLQFLRSSVVLLSEMVILIAIYCFFIYINFTVTIILTVFLLANGILINNKISRVIKEKGKERVEIRRIFYELINRTFSNYKMIKLDSVKNNIDTDIRNTTNKFSDLRRTMEFLNQVPRYLLEAVGFIVVILLVLSLVYINPSDLTQVLPLASIFILGLYRLLPSINKIVTAYNLMMFNLKSVDILYDSFLFKKENIGNESITFNKIISLENVTFSYVKEKKVFDNISLKINKNDKIAFIGDSGGGKSTIVDLIIGLHKPEKGNLLIDNIKLTDENVRSWRDNISYIPQSIYLFDGTVAENIAFGYEIDNEKMIDILKKVHMWDVLLDKEGLDTKVGEAGIMFSGGQKQRLAIARALYKNAEILVLDEATSALDSNTEQLIMDEIYEICNDKTLIIITHRLSTISKCDKIYKIEKGMIENV